MHPRTQAKSQGTEAWRHAANSEEDHSNTQQRLNVASGNFISIHQKLKSETVNLQSAANLFEAQVNNESLDGNKGARRSTVGTARLIPAGSAVVA